MRQSDWLRLMLLVFRVVADTSDSSHCNQAVQYSVINILLPVGPLTGVTFPVVRPR